MHLRLSVPISILPPKNAIQFLFLSTVNDSNFLSIYEPRSEVVGRRHCYWPFLFFFRDLYCLCPLTFFLFSVFILFLLLCKNSSYVIYYKHFPQFVICPSWVLSYLTLSTNSPLRLVPHPCITYTWANGTQTSLFSRIT